MYTLSPTKTKTKQTWVLEYTAPSWVLYYLPEVSHFLSLLPKPFIFKALPLYPLITRNNKVWVNLFPLLTPILSIYIPHCFLTFNFTFLALIWLLGFTWLIFALLRPINHSFPSLLGCLLEVKIPKINY